MPRVGAVKGDITKIEADAIVNAANSTLMGGGGVDGAIHAAGGPQILEECKAIVARQGRCKTGEAVATTAGELRANMVFHTVGPIWNEANAELCDTQLAACYRSCLDLAVKFGVRRIDFPNISTGVYRFPKSRAAVVAVNSVLDWIEEAGEGAELDTILFVCFDEENHSLYDALLAS